MGHREKTVNDARTQGQYILTMHATIRQTASFFDASKSTVYHNVTDVLRSVDYDLFDEVTSILQYNKRQRAMRGGRAISEKYRKLREESVNRDI